MSAQENVLEIRDVAVHFEGRGGLFGRSAHTVKAVNGVSLDIVKGETVALVGESGCGKSTLSNTIVGLRPEASGLERMRWSAQRDAPSTISAAKSR
jgi:oligopeptide transport system ATP-binding protein